MNPFVLALLVAALAPAAAVTVTGAVQECVPCQTGNWTVEFTTNSAAGTTIPADVSVGLSKGTSTTVTGSTCTKKSATGRIECTQTHFSALCGAVTSDATYKVWYRAGTSGAWTNTSATIDFVPIDAECSSCSAVMPSFVVLLAAAALRLFH
eukprot:CAMPEP_0205826240 /NCGR_PEP_ID=MMETSP0206-20130828/28079_1 /ASSEMBLY_ACC=CAM_ASM_000279 /TAXON_ID=36767 /ORGANISM="Euplotes focardii, Strain TN1" /LENGTH=151 /DNA_ID=CAMNT_0053126021 /DNA_START=44 /DNA_END=499 /DNA_ORIENTATION=-